MAAATLWLPRRQRVLIGVDDTDTAEEGATWTLVHNIARAVEDEHTSYLSHTIVQLFPVVFRTKNCVSLVAEFGTTKPETLISTFSELLRKYTLSEKTGMAAYTGFTPSQNLMDYARKVKRGEVTPDLVREIDDPCLRIVMDGRGITGAVAALPFYTLYEEALALCNGKSSKARLLEAGSARLSGEPADDFIAKSTAGPGAGGKGSVFFAMGGHRVKLALNPASPVEIIHRGDGIADLYFGGRLISGRLLRRGFTARTRHLSRLLGGVSFPAAIVPFLGSPGNVRP